MDQPTLALAIALPIFTTVVKLCEKLQSTNSFLLPGKTISVALLLLCASISFGTGIASWWFMLLTSLVFCCCAFESWKMVKPLSIIGLMSVVSFCLTVFLCLQQKDTVLKSNEVPHIGAQVSINGDKEYLLSVHDWVSIANSKFTVSSGAVFFGIRTTVSNCEVNADNPLYIVGEDAVIEKTTIKCAKSPCLRVDETTSILNSTIIFESKPTHITNFTCDGSPLVVCEQLWNSTLPGFATRTLFLRTRSLFPGTIKFLQLVGYVVADLLSMIWRIIGIVANKTATLVMVTTTTLFCGVVEGGFDRNATCFNNETMSPALHQITVAITRTISSTGVPVVAHVVIQGMDMEMDFVKGLCTRVSGWAKLIASSPGWDFLFQSLIHLWSLLGELGVKGLKLYTEFALGILHVQWILFCWFWAKMVLASTFISGLLLQLVYAAILIVETYSTVGIAAHSAICIAQTILLVLGIWRDIQEEAASRNHYWLVSLPVVATTVLSRRFKSIGTYLVLHLAGFIMVMGTNFLPSNYLHFITLQCGLPFASTFALLNYFGQEASRRKIAAVLLVRTVIAIVLQKTLGDALSFAIYELMKVVVPIGCVFLLVIGSKLRAKFGTTKKEQ